MKVRSSILNIKHYEAGKPISEVRREFGLNDSDVIKLASNENPLGCSPLVSKMIIEMSDRVNIYPDASSHNLKYAIAKFHGVSKDMVFCGTGLDLVIRVISNVFVDNGDETIMGAVTFQRYDDSTRLMGGIPVKIPMKDNHLDVDAMIDAINEKTRIIWFCSPNNPTGTIITEPELLSALDRIPSDVAVVMDEAYCDFVTDERYPNTIPLIEKYPNLIVLKTFSKAYGLAGLRVGYGIASPEISKYINSIMGPFDTSSIAQAAAVAALNDQEFVQKVVANNTEARTYIMEELKKMGLDYIDTQANFIMINVNTDDKAVFDKLLRKGVIVRPGYLFGMKGWLRVSFGTKPQNERFISELKNILG